MRGAKVVFLFFIFFILYFFILFFIFYLYDYDFVRCGKLESRDSNALIMINSNVLKL